MPDQLFSKEAIENTVRNLPENQLDIKATSADLKSADVVVSVKKTWRNGWGAGVWAATKLGAGKPQSSAGFEVTKKFGLLGGEERMNQKLIVAIVKQVAKLALPVLAARGINLADKDVELAVEAVITAGALVWAIVDQVRVDRKLKKVARTGQL